MITQIPPPRPDRPILASFIIGNIIGVFDFSYTVTLFHAISGLHLTRTALTVPGLAGLKFGEASYCPNRDIGYLPIGKLVFAVKACPNEETDSTSELWRYLEHMEREESAD